MLSKNLTTMAILSCIVFSIISSGLLSTLFDLSAFVLLCLMLFFKKNNAE